MDLNFSSLLLILFLVGALIFIGREFEIRYPTYIDYKIDNKSSIKQQLRTGAYLVLDYLSDLAWPGKLERAYAFKHSKRTPEQILAEHKRL